MDLASIAVLCAVAGLLAAAIASGRKSRSNGCGGNCTGCAFHCKK